MWILKRLRAGSEHEVRIGFTGIIKRDNNLNTLNSETYPSSVLCKHNHMFNVEIAIRNSWVWIQNIDILLILGDYQVTSKNGKYVGLRTSPQI